MQPFSNDLNGRGDVDERLLAVFTFYGKLFFKPWLREAPGATELISKVEKLERALMDKLNSSSSLIAPAHASAPASAAAH